MAKPHKHEDRWIRAYLGAFGEVLERAGNEEWGIATKSAIRYFLTGEMPDSDNLTLDSHYIFQTMKNQINASLASYEKAIEDGKKAQHASGVGKGG